MTEVQVYAAGGIVRDADGRILLVHRPRYDDWTFPKGKLDPGESLEQCALREVEEETSFACELGDHIVAVRYRDQKGRLKEVHYWAMAVASGSFEANHEVDAICWLAADEVASVLTYSRDQDVWRTATERGLA